MAKFYYVRHGQSTANEARLIADNTPELTQLGRDQALATARKLADKNITKILTSPLIRARQTAETIAAELGVAAENIMVVNDLRERSVGECEGKPKDMESHMYATLDTERGFEPQAVLIERLQRALGSIVEAIGKTDGNVLVVGHVTSGYYLDQIVKGRTQVSDFEPYFHMPNATYIEMELAHD
jgi:broad specificity phosphatase PhoE